MKNIVTILTAMLLTTTVWAQSPEKMTYQSVIRDANDQLITNQEMGMQISILQGSADGTAVYVETHSTSSNVNGLVTVEIGTGTTSDDFSVIDWSIGPYFVKIETDPKAAGGTEYTITGTSQLLSVPYALHANTTDSLVGGVSIRETDPVFDASIAKGISSTDTTLWNNKSEFDGDFSSLYNSPNIANSTNNKTIQLNTNDNTSSLNITKNNGTSVFKTDGSGKITGDGSGLSNVKPLINYVGGDQRYQITANYGSYNNVRSVTMTAPSSGVCFVMASGYVDWESINWDVLLLGILCNQDPNISWIAEDEWYYYLNILTDYNCADSSDQYTSFAQHRCIPVSAGTHTFYLWANKHSASSKVEVADVNLSVMFFPTGGTGKSSNDAMLKEDDPVIKEERVPNTVAGYK